MSEGTHDWMNCSFTVFQQYFSHGMIIINYLCCKTTFIVEKGCRIRLSNGLAVSLTGNKHWLGACRTNALYSGHIFVSFNDLEDAFT